jgi:hypothetical protein
MAMPGMFKVKPRMVKLVFFPQNRRQLAERGQRAEQHF